MKKRLIEWDLPLAEISEESAREKNIRHGHPSTLHIWWARRPLASSRATAFAALIDDPGEENPEEREKLIELIRRIAPWEAVKDGNSEDIEEARELILKQYGQPPRVLDPFAGGGSIPLETFRLGCETYASDYNPIAVFIEKATLEWPQKFGIEIELPEILLEDNLYNSQFSFSETKTKTNLLYYLVNKWSKIILDETQDEIGRFFTLDDDSTPVGYLWARTIPCQNPTCKTEIPLMGQFWLAQKEEASIALQPIPNSSKKVVDFEIIRGSNNIASSRYDPSKGFMSRSDAFCPVCEQVLKAKNLRQLAKQGLMGERLIAIVSLSKNKSGKQYKLATRDDESIYNQAINFLNEKILNWPYIESPLPKSSIPLMSGTFNVPIYGLDSWDKLFNKRQQLAQITFSERIKLAHDKIKIDCKNMFNLIKENELDTGQFGRE